MGLLSEIFNILTADEITYIDSAKSWGDDVWQNAYHPLKGTLSLYVVDDRLYKRFQIKFRNNVIGIFTDESDYGWVNYENHLSKDQRLQLKKQGNVVIKRY